MIANMIDHNLLYFACDLAAPHFFSRFCDQNFTHFLMDSLKLELHTILYVILMPDA